MAKKLKYLRDLVWILTVKELKIRYKNNFLGYIWSLLSPLSQALIFYFALKIIMRFPMPNYALYLLCGLFPWQWIANSLGASLNVFLANASLVRRVPFPYAVLPLSLVLHDALHFLLSIPVIILITFMSSSIIHPQFILYFPVVFLHQVVLLFGLSLAISTLNVFFRDLERLVHLSLNLLFYLTPIIYTSDLIPERLKPFFLLNPFFPLIETWHNLFLKSTVDLGLLLISLVHGLFFSTIGYLVYRKLHPRFSEVL